MNVKTKRKDWDEHHRKINHKRATRRFDLSLFEYKRKILQLMILRNLLKIRENSQKHPKRLQITFEHFVRMF